MCVARGLTRDLADAVAKQLMACDALGTQARDELGIIASQSARPVHAAFASAATRDVGAASPLLVVWLAPASGVLLVVAGSSLVLLAALRAVASQAGVTPVLWATVRVTFWSALAMAATAGIGALFGVVAFHVQAPRASRDPPDAEPYPVASMLRRRSAARSRRP